MAGDDNSGGEAEYRSQKSIYNGPGGATPRKKKVMLPAFNEACSLLPINSGGASMPQQKPLPEDAVMSFENELDDWEEDEDRPDDGGLPVKEQRKRFRKSPASRTLNTLDYIKFE